MPLPAVSFMEGSELFPGTQTAKDLYVIAIVFELAHDLFH